MDDEDVAAGGRWTGRALGAVLRPALSLWRPGPRAGGAGAWAPSPPPDVVFGLRGMFVSLIIGVGGSEALIAISNGVDRKITRLTSSPLVRSSGLVDVDLIARTLALLTTAVVSIMLVNVALNSAVLGEIVMRGRRLEIGIRRGDGAPRGRVLAELMLTAISVALVGTAAGAAGGVLLAVGLDAATPLPARLSVWDWVPPPLATIATVVANLRPALDTVNTPLRDVFGNRT
jgi:hypothetical protein